MKYHWILEQGSLAWHELRWGKVGGSSAKQLFTKTDTLLHQLVWENIEPYQQEEGYVSDAMLRGLELEPAAVAAVEEKTGVKFDRCGWIQSDIDLIGISPDAVNKAGTVGLEIKCLGGKNHTSVLLNSEIPSDYIHQCLHYFTVIETLQELIFACYRPESPRVLWTKTLTPDDQINLGTASRPKMVTVKEAVKQARELAVNLDAEVKIKVQQLTF